MESLRRIVAMEPARIPVFRLDDFQQAVLGNLYLEFFFERCRVLIGTDFGYLTTGEVDLSEPEELEQILAGGRDRLAEWRRYVLFNLALYSALLETNSYYLALNDHLLICRIVPDGEDESEFVLKLYTISGDDLLDNYGDKIYLGRDHVSLLSLSRPHFGIPRICAAVNDQLGKLGRRLDTLVPRVETNLWDRKYPEDLAESVGQFCDAARDFAAAFPETIFSEKLDSETLLAANGEVRGLKHILIEIEETLREMERILMEDGHPRGARYVTRFRKDVANDINFLMLKVNAPIGHLVNRVDAFSVLA